MDIIKATILKYKNVLKLVLPILVIIGFSGCGKDNSTSPTSDENIAQVVKEDSSLSIFHQVIVDAGLEGKLSADGSYTVFAPTNAAFDKLPDGFLDSLSKEQLQNIVNYLTLPEKKVKSDLREMTAIQTEYGDSLFIKVGSDIELNHNATLTEGDIEASNGVIHKLNDVPLPDADLTVFAIIHKRYYLEKFSCQCTSGRTDLDDILESKGSEFTVFAPTNTAFEQMDGNVDDISDSELKHIMEYHVIHKKILSDELTDGETLTTLNGEDITISVTTDGTISINGQATVTQVDLEGVNGVVYVIDSVLDHH